MRGVASAALRAMRSSDPAPEVVVVDDFPHAPEVVDFRCAPQLWDSGSPYTALEYAPSRVVLDVASAGSLYRLSARLLLADVDADCVALDFSGVMDVGDEFLEEIKSWSARRPHVRLEKLNVPESLRARLL
jgi:hypothetical protein